MILWLIGISGSGKSTLGNLIRRGLNAKGVPNVLIDGDLVRSFFDNDLGYSREDRVANIKRILFGAHVLEQTGHVTIICNIHPFQELRDFARRKLRDYHEIYLRKDVEASVRNDVKAVYRQNAGKTDLVGIEIPFEEPKACDLMVDVNRLNIEQSLEAIHGYLRTRRSDWPL